MARYIDADKLVKDIESKRLVFKDTITVSEALLSQGKVIRDSINDAPTADVVEVKHGELVTRGKNGLLICSECNRNRPFDITADEIEYWDANYCPNCGAKMDGKALKEREKE